MSVAILKAQIDDIEKTQFEYFCNSIGVSCSTAINMFVKCVLKEKKMPFELSCNDIPSAETIEALKEAEAILADPNSKGYKDLDELYEVLKL